MKRGLRATAAAVVLIGGLTVVTTAGLSSLSTAVASATAPLCGTTGIMSTAGGTITCTYTTAGEDTFNVPTGVSTLDITAIGADGGAGLPGGAGGNGASAAASVPVPNGVTTLYAEVDTGGGSGGFAPASAGNGGGSSDVRTEPASSGGLTAGPGDPRLIVAGGGGAGGGGGGGNSFYGIGGAGGDAGGAGSGAGAGACTQNPGTTGAIGAGGGAACGNGTAGQAGSGGLGGDGLPLGSGGDGGGGGGGGYTGGGGGGGDATGTSGGGGGGSSFGPPGVVVATSGAAASVSISFAATAYTCTVSGFGTATFPVMVRTSPAPPASLFAGGTFSTAPTAQVTIPASVLNHFITLGATSVTIASQSTALDGRTSVGGALSGAVSPNTESASASNLPLSDTVLLAGVPFSYSTAYNPVTFQTGPGTGKVYLTPGTISAEVTFVIHNTPTPESISCAAPSGAGALGSTTVSAPPPNPTFQVPSSTPPLQNQVTAGTDGGWGLTIANTSTAVVTGLSASVSVADGHAPLTFDLAGMAASGTTCSNAGPGKVTCSVGTLTAGSSDTLDVLVTTNGLLAAVAVTGSATVSSGDAGTHGTSLGTIGVVVIQGGNGTKSVATPGKALVSTKKTLKLAKASVTLKLPTTKITIPKKPKPPLDGRRPEASGSVSIKPPPVAVTLESLAPSAEPALCPPTGSLKCEGDIVQVFGNFSLYTSKLNPISTVVKFFYGAKVPVGSLYFLKPNGKTVDKLVACKKTSAGYNTPCVFGKEILAGTTGNKYAQDTVYFTGNDPAMGRK